MNIKMIRVFSTEKRNHIKKNNKQKKYIKKMF